MKIQWLGHSSFLVTSDSGTRIITDPYEPGAYDGALRYGALNEPVDVIVATHEHADHFSTKMVTGAPIIVRGPGEFVVAGIEFYGVPTLHDTSGGAERGKNTVFTFTVDGIKLCHLGDLGHVLNQDQAAEVGSVDVLLAPVGGHFTIGPQEAWKVAEQLAAKIVIPMHFKTDKVDFPIAGVDEFLDGKPNVTRLDSSTLELKKEDIPKERQIIVLQHAL
ncbi:MAG: MBL fold metallo-hydrolase [Armatimonadetes bacterium]|nr:MBL fold metallo-hydrolase [Armatimonadota bacterium]